jgi:hypothetical protein
LPDASPPKIACRSPTFVKVMPLIFDEPFDPSTLVELPDGGLRISMLRSSRLRVLHRGANVLQSLNVRALLPLLGKTRNDDEAPDVDDEVDDEVVVKLT